MLFFGFSVSDSMFHAEKTFVVTRKPVSIGVVKDILSDLTPDQVCLNPSHRATIDVLNSRFGVSVPVPEKPKSISLNDRDQLLVMQVRGLPRLTDRHEYTVEEVDRAEFSFALWEVYEAKGL